MPMRYTENAKEPAAVYGTLARNRDAIVQCWAEQLTSQFADFFKMDDLILFGEPFFDYMLETDKPLEEHAFFANVPPYCNRLLERGVPSGVILRTHQIWKDCLLAVLGAEAGPGPAELVAAIRTIFARIDALENYVFAYYIDHLRRQLQDREGTISSLHEDRISLIGKLAASMAHEIRNPLTSISGFLKLAKDRIRHYPDHEKLTGYLTIIEEEFHKIHMQITGILGFSRKQIVEEKFAVLSAVELVDSVINLFGPRLLSENVMLVREVEDALLTIQKVSIQQVITNVLNNGLEAFADTPGPKRISIVGRKEPSGYRLDISNNGPEIPEDIRESIFSPFMSAKEGGTGLGLAVCKQLMVKNGGDITFSSGRESTTFTLWFRTTPAEQTPQT